MPLTLKPKPPTVRLSHHYQFNAMNSLRSWRRSAAATADFAVISTDEALNFEYVATITSVNFSASNSGSGVARLRSLGYSGPWLCYIAFQEVWHPTISNPPKSSTSYQSNTLTENDADIEELTNVQGWCKNVNGGLIWQSAYPNAAFLSPRMRANTQPFMEQKIAAKCGRTYNGEHLDGLFWDNEPGSLSIWERAAKNTANGDGRLFDAQGPLDETALVSNSWALLEALQLRFPNLYQGGNFIDRKTTWPASMVKNRLIFDEYSTGFSSWKTATQFNNDIAQKWQHLQNNSKNSVADAIRLYLTDDDATREAKIRFGLGLYLLYHDPGTIAISGMSDGAPLRQMPRTAIDIKLQSLNDNPVEFPDLFFVDYGNPTAGPVQAGNIWTRTYSRQNGDTVLIQVDTASRTFNYVVTPAISGPTNIELNGPPSGESHRNMSGQTAWASRVLLPSGAGASLITRKIRLKPRLRPTFGTTDVLPAAGTTQKFKLLVHSRNTTTNEPETLLHTSSNEFTLTYGEAFPSELDFEFSSDVTLDANKFLTVLPSNQTPSGAADWVQFPQRTNSSNALPPGYATYSQLQSYTNPPTTFVRSGTSSSLLVYTAFPVASQPVVPNITCFLTGATIVEGALIEFGIRSDVTVNSPVTVAWQMNFQTATGQDVGLPHSGTLTIPTGQNQAIASIVSTDDVLIEAVETLSLVFSNPTGGVIAGTPTFLVSIVDNDVQQTSVSFLAATEDFFESALPITIPVVLVQPLDQDASVQFRVSDISTQGPADYAVVSPAVVGGVGTLIFPAGETSVDITISLVDDSVIEPMEGFVIALLAGTQTKNLIFDPSDEHRLEVYIKDTDAPTSQPPATPTNVQVTANGQRSFIMQWPNDARATVFDVHIQRKDEWELRPFDISANNFLQFRLIPGAWDVVGGGTTNRKIVNDSSPINDIRAILPNETYVLRIMAGNTDFSSQWSGIIQFTMPAPPLPTPPVPGLDLLEQSIIHPPIALQVYTNIIPAQSDDATLYRWVVQRSWVSNAGPWETIEVVTWLGQPIITVKDELAVEQNYDQTIYYQARAERLDNPSIVSAWTAVITVKIPQSSIRERLWPIRGVTLKQLISSIRLRMRDPLSLHMQDSELLLYINQGIRVAWPNYGEIWRYSYRWPDDTPWPLSAELPANYTDMRVMKVLWHFTDDKGKDVVTYEITEDNYLMTDGVLLIQRWPLVNGWLSVDLLEPPHALAKPDDTTGVDEEWLVAKVLMLVLPVIAQRSAEDRTLELQFLGQEVLMAQRRSARSPAILDNGSYV